MSFLDAKRLTELTGSTCYPAGVLDRRGGSVDPLAYARGLGHAAVKAGVTLFEQSRVTQIAPNQGRWAVHTRDGVVDAETVVISFARLKFRCFGPRHARTAPSLASKS